MSEISYLLLPKLSLKANISSLRLRWHITHTSAQNEKDLLGLEKCNLLARNELFAFIVSLLDEDYSHDL